MPAFHPQYVIDEKQQRKSVILPVEEREQIMEELEDLDEIRAYDNAKSGSQDAIPLDQAIREIRGEAQA